MAEKIRKLFAQLEEIWAAIPGYVKVFIYSTASSVIGLYAVDALDPKAILLIVATNLGLYQIPRSINQQLQK